MSRRAMRILRLVVKSIVSLVIFLVCAILIWRIFWSGDPKSVTTMVANDRTRAAYAKYGEDMRITYQEQLDLTRAVYVGKPGVDHAFTNKDNYGYFGVTESLFFRDAKQIQLVFRYNNSTIRHTYEDYALEEMPDRDDELYDVTLVLALDLTPDDPTDNNRAEAGSVELVRVQPDKSMTVRDRKNVYNYRRFLFDLPEDLDLSSVLAIYVDVFYVGDVTYLREDFDIHRNEPYGTLCIYDYGSKDRTYKLTKDDVKILSGEE